MTSLIFSFFAKLPLFVLHPLGAVLGWLAYAVSGTYRRRLQGNLVQAGYGSAQQVVQKTHTKTTLQTSQANPRLTRAAAAQAGKMVAELPRLWLGKPVPVQWDGQELVDAAHEASRGVLFLTPHLGCFEVTAQALATRYAAQGKAITVLFRPPRLAWLHTLVAKSRNRPGLQAVPTTLAGVKSLLKALKSGQAVGLLPDQVPPQGLGTWAPFFGRNAYTMTLPARLVQQTGAAVLLIWGERLPQGRGYCVHVRPLPQDLSDNAQTAATQINVAMQQLIALCPEQYLWGYARYKEPRGETH